MTVFLGRVKSGAGKATRNIARDHRRLYKATGISFFPGTLNVILDRPVKFQNQIRCRTWGLCPVRVEGLECFAIRSLRKDYPREFVEVLSPLNIRAKLGLTDGSLITVEIDPEFLVLDC